MRFQTVKQAIVDTLTADAAGRYITVGSQKQSKAAEQLLTPRVAVYYQSGEFDPVSVNGYGGSVQHNTTFIVEISVATKAKVDLSILNSSSATEAQKASALTAVISASDEADEVLDQAYSDVFNVIMDGRNIDFGLAQYEVQDRLVPSFRKDSPHPQGEYLTLTGRMEVTLSVEEELLGDTGTPGVAFDTQLDIQDDQGDNAGASGDLGGT